MKPRQLGINKQESSCAQDCWWKLDCLHFAQCQQLCHMVVSKDSAAVRSTGSLWHILQLSVSLWHHGTGVSQCCESCKPAQITCTDESAATAALLSIQRTLILGDCEPKVTQAKPKSPYDGGCQQQIDVTTVVVDHLQTESQMQSAHKTCIAI